MNQEYFNEITKELDKYLLYSNSPYCFDTYIIAYDTGLWSIRFPGATRGHIRVDDSMIITEIKLYDDTAFGDKIGCYKREAIDVVRRFIGTKLELHTDEN